MSNDRIEFHKSDVLSLLIPAAFFGLCLAIKEAGLPLADVFPVLCAAGWIGCLIVAAVVGVFFGPDVRSSIATGALITGLMVLAANIGILLVLGAVVVSVVIVWMCGAEVS